MLVKGHKFSLRRLIYSRHRRNPLVRFLARHNELSVRAFNNENRDMAQNGEQWLMGVAHDYFRKKYDQNIVFDVGANVGDWALRYHSISPASKIHCFELAKETSLICRSNTEAIDQIEVLSHGLSDKTEQTTVFLNDSSDVTSLYRRGLDGIQNKIHPGDPIDKNLYDLPPEELKDVPTVCGSLRQAAEALAADMDFLLAGDVFTKDQIDSYLELKWEEIYTFEHAPHPIEFQMYYSS